MQTIYSSLLFMTLTGLAHLLATVAQLTKSNEPSQRSDRWCRIRSVDPLMYGRIRIRLSDSELNLIKYTLTFRNYSYNPMTTNVTHYHKADVWSRVSTPRGQTMLSLTFNYGILSLMTLTFGTKDLLVELEDIPNGCIGELHEEEKFEMVLQLLKRDFNEFGNVSIVGREKICGIKIRNESGYARFVSYCCFLDRLEHKNVCEFNEANKWLRFLGLTLLVVRCGVLIFGPLLFLSTIARLVNKKCPYVVELKEPLKKRILLFEKEPDATYKKFKVRRCVNLQDRSCRDLPKLMKSLCRKSGNGDKDTLLDERPFCSFIYEYQILVSYTRLLVENEIPLGFWRWIVNTVFFCELRDIGPFADCCKQKVCINPVNASTRIADDSPTSDRPKPTGTWIVFWKLLGLGLLVLLLPMPYYLRLFLFYHYESNEVLSQKEAASRLGLRKSFENSLVHSLLPTHPLFLCIYAIYFTVALAFAIASKMKESRFKAIVVGSFEDLSKLSWVDVLGMMASNVIWPFEKFGILGVFVAFIYWPVVLPFTCIVSLGYFLPTVYLTIGMLFYSEKTMLERFKSFFDGKPGKKMERSQQLFEIKAIWNLFHGSDKTLKEPEEKPHVRKWMKSIIVAESEVDKIKKVNQNLPVRRTTITDNPTKKSTSNCGEIAVHVCISTLCVAAMYCILVILSECIGCLVEMTVFTLMGIIVNAGTLLKFTALALLMLVYVYDSFNNVEKKYLQLNKALFNNVKERVKDRVKEVTGLPSELQKNTGFKSQEVSQQARHEEPDDVAELSRHWFINDLVLFVDQEDVPRIPKKLFDEVCKIRVSGVPGPMHLGLLSALYSFIKMMIFVMFVFLAILSFGNALGLSSTSQTIAALAGGAVPLVFRTFMKAPQPDIDMGTVSFTSRLDEVIMNFYQFWEMKDFSFKMQTKEESKDKVASTQSGNPAADSGRDINGGSTTCLRETRRNDDGKVVDIAIILPKDFDVHWSEVWSTFCERMEAKKKKDKTTVCDTNQTHIKQSKTRERVVYTDDEPAKERQKSSTNDLDEYIY